MGVEATADTVALVEHLFLILLLEVLVLHSRILILHSLAICKACSLLPMEKPYLLSPPRIVDNILIAFVFLILEDLNFGDVQAVGRLKENALHYLLELNLCRANVLQVISVQVAHLGQRRELVLLIILLSTIYFLLRWRLCPRQLLKLLSGLKWLPVGISLLPIRGLALPLWVLVKLKGTFG